VFASPCRTGTDKYCVKKGLASTIDDTFLFPQNVPGAYQNVPGAHQNVPGAHENVPRCIRKIAPQMSCISNCFSKSIRAASEECMHLEQQ